MILYRFPNADDARSCGYTPGKWYSLAPLGKDLPRDLAYWRHEYPKCEFIECSDDQTNTALILLNGE